MTPAQRTSAMWCHFSLDDAAPGLRCVMPEALLQPLPDVADFLRSAGDRQAGFGSMQAAIGAAVSTGCDAVWLARNPQLVLDRWLRDRLLASREPARSYALASPAGLCLDGLRVQSAYCSHEPSLVTSGNHEFITDTRIDSSLIRPAVIDAARRDLGIDLFAVADDAFEWMLIQAGYHLGWPSAYVPSLAAHIDGPYLAPDGAAREEAAMQLAERARPGGRLRTLPTYAGSVDVPTSVEPGNAGETPPDDVYEDTIDRASGALSLSVITRTQFRRPHLLARLLSSIEAAMTPSSPVDVVLATDVEPETGEAELARLRQAHPQLDIALVYATEDLPSRCRNLVAGIRAARSRYAWIVDDDDFIDPSALRLLPRFLNKQHDVLLFMNTELRDEVWDLTDPENPVLTASSFRHLYPASGWRHLGSGVNQIPVCGFIAPARALRAAVDRLPLRHDLSEDYALLMIVLSTFNANSVRATESPLAHVSIRGQGENSVSISGQSWTRDIGNYLYQITCLSSNDHPKIDK